MPRYIFPGSLALLGLAVFVLSVIPVLFPGRRPVPGAICIANLKQQQAALQQYAIDYNDHLPNAQWADRLTNTYLKGDWAFRCPMQKKPGFGYAFNASLVGKSLEQVTEPERMALIFESTNSEKNALSTNSHFSTRHEGQGYVYFVRGGIASLDTASFKERVKP